LLAFVIWSTFLTSFNRRIWLNSSSSEADLTFLVADQAESTGLISIAMAVCLVLDDGSFNRNTLGILVALLSQSGASDYVMRDNNTKLHRI